MADAKKLLTTTSFGRRLLLPRYRYQYSPEQLWSLCETAEAALLLGGAFAEIGVYDGTTTVYLHRHLQSKGPAPTYYCIDTFSGFTEEDIEVEMERGNAVDYANLFYFNNKETFERTMKLSGLDRTIAIQADAATFDYTSLQPLSFALIDVDLLRPVRAALNGCWEKLLPGGVLVIDDCDVSVKHFDGAYEAFVEFCELHDLPVDIRFDKLGFATRPVAFDHDPPVAPS